MTAIRDAIEAGAWRLQHLLAGMLGDSHHVALFWRILLTLLAIGALLLCMMEKGVMGQNPGNFHNPIRQPGSPAADS